MRIAFCILAISAGSAGATSLWEAPADGRWVAAEHVASLGCDVDVQLHGTIAEVSQTERVRNAGKERAAIALELPLPDGAKVVAASARIAGGKSLAAVALPEGAPTDVVHDAAVLGPDPVTVLRSPSGYRIVVQPLEPGRDAAVTVTWTAIAEVRGGAIRLVLPGRPDGKLAPCSGKLHAVAGPGASIARVHAGDSAQLVVADRAVTVSADLEFSSKAPVVWRQTEDLGNGWSAQAVTVLAPPVKGTATIPRRVLLVIDTSRSMQLVGNHVLVKLLHALEKAVPSGTELEAIFYDRTATRVLGSWQPAEAPAFAAIEKALEHRTAVNGSDALAALELAHKLVGDGARGQTMVIAVTDGVLGSIANDALGHPLLGDAANVDLHAIVVDPSPMTTPGEAPLRGAVSSYGGSFIEVSTKSIDEALEGIDGWLRPSWLELQMRASAPDAVAGRLVPDVPASLRAGTGVTLISAVHGPRTLTLTGRLDDRFEVTARPGPAARITELLLSSVTEENLTDTATPYANETDTQLAAMLAKHPAADPAREFVVLSDTGKVAASRRAMVVGGGPFSHMVEVDDPPSLDDPDPPATAPQPRYAQIERITLERLFRDQLRPRAYACYERALGKHPGLGGKVTFALDIGRGEVSRAEVTGLGDAAFDACLLDVAYSLELPLPDPASALDDLTIAHYPLEFRMHEDKPFVIAGDADSSSPLDISKITPLEARGPVSVETKTPLGNLRVKPTE